MASYHQICNYTIVFPQNPSFLFNLLFSSIFQLHNIIKVVLASKQLHITANIYLFGCIRKIKVLNTLFWLKKIIFYKDIIINYQKLDN